jgi:hypothetical protein
MTAVLKSRSGTLIVFTDDSDFAGRDVAVSGSAVAVGGISFLAFYSHF